ncbi:MAG: alpha/beta fold hydrolase [Acidobacteriota bacterium]
MHQRTRFLIATFLIAVLTTPLMAQSAGESSARRALETVFARDWKTFSAMADARMNELLTAETFAAIPAALEQQYGKLEKIGTAAESRKDDLELFTFEVALEKADLAMLIVHDGAGKVAGLRVLKVTPRNEQWTAPEYVDRSRFSESAVHVGTTEFPLEATLTIPKVNVPVPAVVLVHGSGPNDRDESIGPNKPFRDLAWGLASRGIAVLRFDKRTFTYGATMNPATVTLEDESIDDALSAVVVLRSRKEIDPHRIYILGHSLGAVAAPYIARRDERIAGIISVSGPARPMLDVLIDQLQYLGAGGSNSDAANKQLDDVRAMTLLARSARSLNDEQILGVPLAYWRDLDRRDPAAVAAKLGRPVLVIQGGRDYQVTAKDFAVWEKALAGQKRATLILFEDLNHLMIAGQGRSTPSEYASEGHVAAKVVTAIADWITKGSVPKH